MSVELKIVKSLVWVNWQLFQCWPVFLPVCDQHWRRTHLQFCLFLCHPGKYTEILYVHHSIRLSICKSVYVSNRVCSMSPEPLNHFLPNLVRWFIIMRRCVMWKNWFTIFNVKVTARAYIIKRRPFLLYLLSCWYVCNQIWFVSTASEARVSCGKEWITVFKVKIIAKVQNVNECLSGWYLLNHRTFYYRTWYE